MQHDWFMYHLRSTYKNRPDFPFKDIGKHNWKIAITRITFTDKISFWPLPNVYEYTDFATNNTIIMNDIYLHFLLMKMAKAEILI